MMLVQSKLDSLINIVSQEMQYEDISSVEIHKILQEVKNIANVTIANSTTNSKNLKLYLCLFHHPLPGQISYCYFNLFPIHYLINYLLLLKSIQAFCIDRGIYTKNYLFILDNGAFNVSFFGFEHLILLLVLVTLPVLC